MDDNANNKQVIINIERFVLEKFPLSVYSGIEKACQLVENEAKRNCPTDDGILKASIHHVVKENAYEGVVGTNVEYAPYVHEGTGIYAKNGNGRQTPWKYQDAKGQWHTTQGQKSNPFLQNAADSNYQNILDCFKELI